ncbi:MAG: DUF488 domain-containing protein [Candidatus Coatesbacteria bacterium]
MKGPPVVIYTIGTSRKKPEEFYTMLRSHRIERVIDIRFRNTSPRYGYAREKVLQAELARSLGCAYVHMLELAPNKELLDAFKSATVPKKGPSRELKKAAIAHAWAKYAHQFAPLMHSRNVFILVGPGLFREKRTVLLCACPDERICHRRLVAQMLARRWGNTIVRHLAANGEVAEWKPGDANYPDDDLSSGH